MHGFDKGGPSQSTEAISFLIYNNGMGGGKFGFQSANAFVFFVMIVAFYVAQMIKGLKENALYQLEGSEKVISGAALMYGGYSFEPLFGNYPGTKLHFAETLHV